MELPCGHDVGGLLQLRPQCTKYGCTRATRGGYVSLEDGRPGERGIRIDLACLRHRFAVRRELRKSPDRVGRALWTWGTPLQVLIWSHADGRCDDTKYTSVTPQRR